MHKVARKGKGERENEFSPLTPSEQPPTEERTIVINHVNLNKLNRQVEVNLTIGVYNLNLENFGATCSRWGGGICGAEWKPKTDEDRTGRLGVTKTKNNK